MLSMEALRRRELKYYTNVKCRYVSEYTVRSEIFVQCYECNHIVYIGKSKRQRTHLFCIVRFIMCCRKFEKKKVKCML